MSWPPALARSASLSAASVLSCCSSGEPGTTGPACNSTSAGHALLLSGCLNTVTCQQVRDKPPGQRAGWHTSTVPCLGCSAEWPPCTPLVAAHLGCIEVSANPAVAQRSGLTPVVPCCAGGVLRTAASLLTELWRGPSTSSSLLLPLSLLLCLR